MTVSPMVGTRPPKPARRLAVRAIFGSLLVSLVAAEILLRLLAPLPDPYARFKVNRPPKPISHEFPLNFSFETEAEPGLPGMPPGRRRFTTNNVGFRGSFLARPKPAAEYRLFMVGGSTAECFYLDDTEAVTFVLEEELKRRMGGERQWRVYGAGQSGNISYDHVAMISQRIVHLEPDMIIVLCGVNDLSAAIFNADYCFFRSESERYSFRNLVSFVATEFQLPRYLYAPLKRLTGRSASETQQTITGRSIYRLRIAQRRQAPVAKKKPRADLAPYGENLKSIIGVARANGIHLVLVTQPSSWNSRVDPKAAEWHWMTHRDGVRYPEEWMDEALEKYNDVMRRLGEENGVPVLDLARGMKKSLEFFYDDCHYNVAGARYVGEELGFFVSRRFATK